MKKIMMAIIVSAMLVPMVMADPDIFKAVSFDVPVGTIDGGNLFSTMFVDADTLDISETTGSPAYYITYTFLAKGATRGNLSHFIWYDGNLVHEVDVDMFNFDSETWDNIGEIPDGDELDWVNFTIPNFSSHIEEDTGLMRVRMHHVDSGNTQHDLFIDYIAVDVDAEASSTASAVAAGLMWAIVLGLGVMVMFFGMKNIFKRI